MKIPGNLGKATVTIALAAAGTILAGWVMRKLYGQVPFITDASDGFDQ